MIVKLKRDLYIDGVFLKASKWGTEVPDEISGRPVVLDKDKAKHKSCWTLPKDAEILQGPLVTPKVKDEPTTLSQAAAKAAKPKSFVEAMDEIEN
jgi:hypothetical protein